MLDPLALAATQQRLFKLNTYIERACRRGVGEGARRLVGLHKSPLGALASLGTAQSKTRHPEDDLTQRCVAMDCFIERVGAQLAGWPMGPQPPPLLLRKALRVAIVRHWKIHIVESGWQDGLRLSRRLRRQIARQVAAQLGCMPGLLLRQHLLARPPLLVADLLDAWARQEGLDFDAAVAESDTRSLEQAMAAFRRLHRGGDILLPHPDPGQVRELLHHAIADTRQTYSVAFSSSCNIGLQLAINDILLPTPALAGAGPGLAMLGSRGATLVVGSNVHGGQCALLSQRGGRLELGAAGFVGKGVEGVVNLGLTASLMPVMLEHSRSQGVVLRTRMNVFGTDDTDAWRSLLCAAIDALTWKQGESGPPDDAAQAWAQLAAGFYKNPSFSIDGLRSRQTTAGSSATLTLGARAPVAGGTQVGPLASLGFGKVWKNDLRQADAGANRCARLEAASASRAGVATLALTGLAPAIRGEAIEANAGHAGTSQALLLTSANFGSRSVSFLRNAAGVTIRLVVDQGRVDADYTVMDTETGCARDFAAYIDSQRQPWLAALGGGPAAAQELDSFLTRLVTEEKRGNVTYGERRRLTPQAARRIDFFSAMAAALSDTALPARRGLRAEVAAQQAEVSRVLHDAASWDPRSLWVLDLTQVARTRGLSLLLQLNSRKTVSAARQRGMLFARRMVRREAAEEVEF